MARRIYMWIAVASLTGFALANVTPWLAHYSSGGSIHYTSTGQASDPVAAWVLQASRYANAVFLPIGALSLAGYILLLDRDVRAAHSRGFNVGTPAEPAAHNPPL